jgi:nicotinamide mononucleotide transporter
VTSLCVFLTAHGSSCLELVAVLFGVVSVFLSVRENIWSWPTALVNVALYFALFDRTGLYSDMWLQAVYFAQSIYGWYEWLHGGAGRTALTVTRTPLKLWGILAVVGTAFWAVDGAVMARAAGSALPHLDAATATVSLVAQYLMTRKLLENWALWIGVDLVYVGMFIYKGLYLTAGNYAIYLVLAVLGHLAWRRSLADAAAEPAPAAA